GGWEKLVGTDATRQSGGNHDVLGPSRLEEILDLIGTGQVRLVGRRTDQVFVPGAAELLQQGDAQQGPAAGDVDTRPPGGLSVVFKRHARVPWGRGPRGWSWSGPAVRRPPVGRTESGYRRARTGTAPTAAAPARRGRRPAGRAARTA